MLFEFSRLMFYPSLLHTPQVFVLYVPCGPGQRSR